MPRKGLKLTKRTLTRFIKENKATKFIAGYFKVSERTIYYRIKKHGLKGIRKRGKKPLPIVKPVPIPKGWITANSYINKLNRQYYFRNITFLPTRYINTNTLVCSNRKREPKRKFTICTVYYVAFESQLYFLYPIQIKYSRKPVSFDEIYHYVRNRAYDLITAKLKGSSIEVVEIVAYHFFIKNRHVSKGTTEKMSRSVSKTLNPKNQWS